MRSLKIALALVAGFPSPALACRDGAKANLADIKLADVVVEGRVRNYVVLSTTNPTTPGRRKNTYAQFDILVDDLLLGQAPRVLTATVDYPFFTELKWMEPGPYVIALRSPATSASAGYTPNPTRTLANVLQEGCSPAFVFDTGSKEAAEIRRTLRGAK